VEWEFSLDESMDSIFSPSSLRDFASEGAELQGCGGWEELISASNTLRRCRVHQWWTPVERLQQPASLCQSQQDVGEVEPSFSIREIKKV
jgi:hypothetical protein